MSAYKIHRKNEDGTLEEVILQGAGGDSQSGQTIHYVPDTTITVTKGASSLSEKWVVDGIDGITTPFDGMIIAIKMPTNQSSTVSGIAFSMDGGTTYYPMVRNSSDGLYYEYDLKSIVVFVFNSTQANNLYLSSGTKTSVTGSWQVSDYNNNSNQVYQQKKADDAEYPIITKYQANTNSITAYVSFGENTTINPAKGRISATEFYENGVSLAEKYGSGGSGGGSSSTEPFIVTFTNDGNNNYTTDVTYEDIEQAFANGKIVIGKDATNSYIYQIFGLCDDDTIPFSRIVTWGENGADVETLFVNTDDSVSCVRTTLASTALATTTNKGLMSAADKKKLDDIPDGGGANNAQPLYRHDIKLEDNANDTYFLGITLFSSDETPYNTFEQVKNLVGIGNSITASGACGGSQDPVYSLHFDANGITIWYGSYCEEFIQYEDIDMRVIDSVAPIAELSGVVGVGGSGGQPLYRHVVNVYEVGSDSYEVYLQLVSTSSESVDTEEKLREMLGTQNACCLCTGTFMVDGAPYHASAIRSNGYGEYYIETDVNLIGQSKYLFNDSYQYEISDSVTPIGTASVGGDGSSVVKDLGEMEGHLTAQSYIISLLKPASVPDGNYIYTYSNNCREDSAIAICYKFDARIRGTQITSDAKYRTFQYDIDSETSNEQCISNIGSDFGIEEGSYFGSMNSNIELDVYANYYMINHIEIHINISNQNISDANKVDIYNNVTNEHLITQSGENNISLIAKPIYDELAFYEYHSNEITYLGTLPYDAFFIAANNADHRWSYDTKMTKKIYFIRTLA